MISERTIRSVRILSWVLFAANVAILFGIKGGHSAGTTSFFLVSIGLGALAFITYCIARFRKQTQATRDVIQAITPLAMLGAIVLGIIVLCVLVPMLIQAIG